MVVFTVKEKFTPNGGCGKEFMDIVLSGTLKQNIMSLQKTLLFVAIVIISLLGCKKSATSADPENGSGTMSATIDGVDWKAVKITLAVWTSGQLHIKGEAADGSLIQLSLLDVDQAGTYHVGGISSVNSALFEDADEKGWMTTVLTPEGTVEVTNLTSSGTKGTFSFTGSDAVTEKNITNGKFDVKF